MGAGFFPEGKSRVSRHSPEQFSWIGFSRARRADLFPAQVERFERPVAGLESAGLPLTDTCIVQTVGFEPTRHGLQPRALPIELRLRMAVLRSAKRVSPRPFA